DLLLGRPQQGDLARHLLLAGGELRGKLVYALSHRGETERYRVELLLLIGTRGLGGLRGCGLRCQPAKLRGRACDHLSGRVAVGEPSQGGSDTDAKRDQETGEGARGSLAERRPVVRERVIFQVGPARSLVSRGLGQIWRDAESLTGQCETHLPLFRLTASPSSWN